MYDVCSMLTKKQKNLLVYINKKIRSTGVSPSYEEMKSSLNLKSKSGIHRLISALEERGFIKRLAHKARALEVLKLPETASANDIYNPFSPSVIKGGLDINNQKDKVNEIPVDLIFLFIYTSRFFCFLVSIEQTSYIYRSIKVLILNQCLKTLNFKGLFE